MASFFKEIGRTLFFSDVPDGAFKPRKTPARSSSGVGGALFFDDLQSVKSLQKEKKKEEEAIQKMLKEQLEERERELDSFQMMLEEQAEKAKARDKKNKKSEYMKMKLQAQLEEKKKESKAIQQKILEQAAKVRAREEKIKEAEDSQQKLRAVLEEKMKESMSLHLKVYGKPPKARVFDWKKLPAPEMSKDSWDQEEEELGSLPPPEILIERYQREFETPSVATEIPQERDQEDVESRAPEVPKERDQVSVASQEAPWTPPEVPKERDQESVESLPPRPVTPNKGVRAILSSHVFSEVASIFDDRSRRMRDIDKLEMELDSDRLALDDQIKDIERMKAKLAVQHARARNEVEGLRNKDK